MTVDLERLLEPGCTDLPECRCGKEMHFAHVVFVPNVTETHIRVYACAECDHQMRLTVWENYNVPLASNWSGPPKPARSGY